MKNAFHNFLEKIKVKDHFTTALSISKDDFLSRLSSIVEEADMNIFADAFDVFSSSRKEYKGQVSPEGFKFKRRKKMFDMNLNFATVKGKIDELNGQLVIETEINGFTGVMPFFYAMLVFIYSMIVLTTIKGNGSGVLVFIIPHGIFMFLIPYFMMRRSVSKMKYELEREFFFLTKKS
ncbi:MAG TPA: hypothetical protein VNB90_00120 [Cytophagaceae bacterium]|nr:hypothetical protein [Cytophagaceae bacterium]